MRWLAETVGEQCIQHVQHIERKIRTMSCYYNGADLSFVRAFVHSKFNITNIAGVRYTFKWRNPFVWTFRIEVVYVMCLLLFRSVPVQNFQRKCVTQFFRRTSIMKIYINVLFGRMCSRMIHSTEYYVKMRKFRIDTDVESILNFPNPTVYLCRDLLPSKPKRHYKSSERTPPEYKISSHCQYCEIKLHLFFIRMAMANWPFLKIDKGPQRAVICQGH